MEQDAQSNLQESRQDNSACVSAAADAQAPAEKLPQMGNRSLMGKMSVRYIDTVILVSAIVLIALFVFFIIRRG